MKDINSIFKDIPCELVSGSMSGDITEVVYDSRKAEKGCLFVALRGASFDAHDVAQEVADRGAACLVLEDADCIKDPKDAAVIVVEDSRRALALISAAFFDHPSREIGVIGITGTKGKTTTTYLIKDVLDRAGKPTGLMGTIETIIGDEHIHALNTTPESYIIQRDLRRMADAGLKYCVMEVSSQGIMMHRVLGVDFLAGIFTNISPDHIGPNEHSDFDEYLHYKSLLFSQCRAGFFNADDPHVEDILKGHTCQVTTYGIEHEADVMAEDISFVHDPGALGTLFSVKGKINIRVHVMLPGYFSVYNALSAVCLCSYLGVDESVITEALRQARVRGRIELVDVPGDYTMIIDYAHNAVSLESILKTLRAYEPGRLVSIFGCGGNRDPERRFSMGEVSGRFADLTIITSDNPRFEEPLDIMENIKTGIERTQGEYVMVEDRKEAVRYAVQNARPKDVILLAGKGHEDYQEIRGERFPMDERTIIMEVLKEEGLLT